MKLNTSKIALLFTAAFMLCLVAITRAEPTLSANGKIAFTTDRDGNSEIYLMNADGSGQTRLTNNSFRDDFPTWSPDGRTIAFMRQNGSISSINLMNADGTNQTELTRIIPNNIQSYPYERFGMSWSPDGTKIAFQDTTDIFTINIDGSNRANLTAGQFVNYEPSWSPDGSRIAFARSIVLSHGFYPNVYTMNADGGNVTRITTSAPYGENRSPDWSPDGGQIAVDDNGQDDAFITLVNPDGTSPQHNPWGSKPKWSPDGTKIVFYESYYPAPPISQIWVMNRNGSGLTQLTNTSPNNFHPDWQPLTPELNFTVTRSDDRNNPACVPGDCSLREAVNAANASGSGTIGFASDLTTITLTNEILIHAIELTINGPGANILTIDGGAGTNRIFYADHRTSRLTISGVTLTGGNGTGVYSSGLGGAIFANVGLLTLDGVHLTGNSSIAGGGLYSQDGECRITNSTISGNTAVNGGGFARNYFLSPSPMKVVNSTISGNTAQAGGGFFTSGDTTLRNVTITNNTAQRGGGIFQSGDEDFPTESRINFGNTIVAGNTATSVRPEFLSLFSFMITSAGGNLVGDSPGDSAIPGLTYQASDIRDTDPRLGPLQNNGGTTPTHALLGGSPTIDSGLNTLVSPLAPAFDQRGTVFPRILDGNGDGGATVDIGAFEVEPVYATNIEKLYSTVNNPQNAGALIIIAPGVYMLSVNDPGGNPRPNSGRLEFQENMSLQGVVGDRGAVVIDAINLPRSSFDNAPPVTLTGAIRMGRGTNAIEWLTARNAVNGNANIGTDLASTATNIRVAHVASSNSQRGIDLRNFGAAMAGRVINAEIIDNDIYNNRIGLNGEGIRIASNNGANGGIINATLVGNRGYNNYLGVIVDNNQSNNAVTTVSSSGNRFFENGVGAVILGGLSQGSNVANGNTISFTAYGDIFENNNGFNNFDFGGLVIVGGENTSFPNGTSNNTVNVELRSCRFANNQIHDLAAFGARSSPASIGLPGTNNRVKVRLYGTHVPVLETVDSIPDYPEGMNSVTITRPTTFDYDNDGKTDISVFRPSTNEWHIFQSGGGIRVQGWGLAGDKMAPADFDGDGKTDLAVFRPNEGNWYVINSSNNTVTIAGWGLATDKLVPGDYNGDGKADFVVFRESEGRWYHRDTDGQVHLQDWGLPGDNPAPADFDGDGRLDLTVFRPSEGRWYTIRSGDAAITTTDWGVNGDIPVAADYSGDGKADFVVFRPSDLTWYRRHSDDNSLHFITWGLVGDIPVPGDFDGDGKTDLAVFRPSNGTWYVFGSTSGIYSQPFGLAADLPTPNAFVY